MTHAISQEQAMHNLEISQHQKKRKERQAKTMERYSKARSKETLIAAFKFAKGRYTFASSLASRAVIKGI